MSDWKEIKRPFREALISAFNWNRLEIVLQYRCERRLDRITAENEGFDKNVDDLIADAVQTGWLETLAKGALAENEKHSGLIATVPPILEGVKNEGRAYYQVFSEMMQTYKDGSQSSYTELSRRSDVPRSTIANWTRGTKPQRRRWQDFIRLASSLDLTGQQVDDLLIFLSLPPVRELHKISAYEDDDEIAKILGQWVDALEALKLRVFMCHVSDAKEDLGTLYRLLIDSGVDPWLDEFNLLPEMERGVEIDRAVRESDVVLVYLSKQAVTDAGSLHEDIGAVLDIVEQQPQDAISLIPVRAGPCDMPKRLSEYQGPNLYAENGYSRLLRALQRQAASLGKVVSAQNN